MTSWMRDVRQAVRALRGSPGFTLSAVATLAIGIGSTAAMFAIVNGVLFRPLPFPGADRLVSIAAISCDAPGRPPTVSIEELRDWQRGSRTMASFFGWRDWGMTRHVDGRTEPAFGVIVTPEVFDVLPVRPVQGRLSPHVTIVPAATVSCCSRTSTGASASAPIPRSSAGR